MSTGISGSKTVLMTSTIGCWNSAVLAGSTGPTCGTSPSCTGFGAVRDSVFHASGGWNGVSPPLSQVSQVDAVAGSAGTTAAAVLAFSAASTELRSVTS